ncbi:MAG: hypothetical protein ABWX74_02645 [Aeromicrobium sp.]
MKLNRANNVVMQEYAAEARGPLADDGVLDASAPVVRTTATSRSRLPARSWSAPTR